MSFIELLLIGVGLSMDAFAVSVCKGLSMKTLNLKYCIISGLYFGIFQALMPVIGYFAGSAFSKMVTSVDHWIVFILLSFIGGKMIFESLQSESDEIESSSVEDTSSLFSIKEMLSLAIATSIDALAVGISFAFLKVNIFFSASVIGLCTFIISSIGVLVGNYFGGKFRSKAEFAGGAVLVIIGVKILAEHLGFL